MKAMLLSVWIGALVGVMGCSNPVSVASNVTENPQEILKNPPALEVSIGDIGVPARVSAQKWSYIDEKEQATVTVEAETIAPVEMTDRAKGTAVATGTAVELVFTREPKTYEFYQWNSTEDRQGPFRNIQTSEESGKAVYEVVAEWEQGTAHYVFVVTVE